jgi:hypothetical protein
VADDASEAEEGEPDSSGKTGTTKATHRINTRETRMMTMISSMTTTTKSLFPRTQKASLSVVQVPEAIPSVHPITVVVNEVLREVDHRKSFSQAVDASST